MNADDFFLRTDADEFHAARLAMLRDGGVHRGKGGLVDFHLIITVLFARLRLCQAHRADGGDG